MLRMFGIILILLLVAMLLLCVRVIVMKNGRFGAKDVGQSAEMRKRGIHCARTMDAEMRRTRGITERRER